PAYVVAHASRGYKVSLIGRIDKHFALIGISAKRGERHDAAIPLPHTTFTIKPFVPPYIQLKLLHIILENLFGDMGFKDPHGPGIPIHGRSALTFIDVFHLLLPAPCRTVLVMILISEL